jgi:hypothetical protein
MNQLYLFLLSAILLVSIGWSESKQNKPEKETKVQNQTKSLFKKDSVFTFDADEVGKMPAGWSNYFTGKGGWGKWEIREDNGNKVLAQVSQENFGYHFDVIVLDSSDYQNLEMTVKFRSIRSDEEHYIRFEMDQFNNRGQNFQTFAVFVLISHDESEFPDSQEKNPEGLSPFVQGIRKIFICCRMFLKSVHSSSLIIIPKSAIRNSKL